MSYHLGSKANSPFEGINHTFQVGSYNSLSSDEQSRKRKLIDLQKGSTMYDNSGSSVCREVPVQNAGQVPHQGSHEMTNFRSSSTQPSEMYMTQRLQNAHPNNMWFQGPQHGSCNMNRFPTNSQATVATDNTKKDSSVPHTFHRQEPSASLNNAATIEIPRLPYSQHFTYNVANQAEQSQIPNAIPVRNMQPGWPSGNGMNLQQVSHGNLSQIPFMSTGSLHSSELSQPRLSNNGKLSHHVNPDQNILNQESYSLDVIGSGKSYESTNSQRSSNNPLVSALAEQVQHNYNNVHVPSTMGVMQIISRGNSFVAESTSIFPNGLDAEKVHNVQEERLSRQAGDANLPIERQTKSFFSNVEAEDKSISSRRVVPSAGQLWDGILQLNTSTTLSAVAFFRSGEKATEIDWSQYVEVKGKVRLEAFEKYIQELPRSRNRALMVISLCWKVGSSETGLLGIKEVAKGYKETQKVGFAQLSPGIDLYVCPRSETIITILAKYGFFKGMAAVEENPDSLIGCVIWRRNHTPLNGANKKPETNQVSLDSEPGNFPSNTAIEANSRPAKLHDSEHNQSSLCITESVEISPGCGPVQYGGGNSNEGRISCPALSSTSAEKLSFESFKGTTHPIQLDYRNFTQLPSAQNQRVTSSQAFVEPKPNNEISIKAPDTRDLHVRPPTPGVGKNSAESVDDDLPEFDFGSACGAQRPSVSNNQWPRGQADSSVHHPNNKQVLPEGISSSYAPLPSEPPPSRYTEVNAMKPQTSFARSFSNKQDTSSMQNVGENIPESKFMGRSSGVSGKLGNVEVDSGLGRQGSKLNFSRKSIWDDEDDDMPEWCPPNLERDDPPSLPKLLPPPLPPYPRPVSPTVSRPIPSSQILQTTEGAPSWAPAAPHSQLQVHPRGNQQTGLLGPGPPNSNPRLQMNTIRNVGSFQFNARPCTGDFHGETLTSQSSGFKAKNYQRHSAGKNSDKTPTCWQDGFNQDHNRFTSSRPDQKGTLQSHRTSFDAVHDRKWSPKRKSDEPSRRRTTGFDVLPEDKSPGFSPRDGSGRRRPSPFDVKPSYGGRRG